MLVGHELAIDQENVGYPLFAKARQQGRTIEFDFALIGHGATFAGSGDLVSFSFTSTNGEAPEIELVDALLLDNNNSEIPVAMINDARAVSLPQDFALSQNYPNPFNPTTQIDFQLPHPCHVTLDVYNLVGQRVARIVDGYFEAGARSVLWNGEDASGKSVSSGVYFYRINAGSYTASRKMVLLK